MSKEPSKEKPKDEIKFFEKKCGLCDEVIKVKIEEGDKEGKDAQRLASQRMSEHIEKEHPEPEDEKNPITDTEGLEETQTKKKLPAKNFQAICDQCGHTVESDTQEKAEDVMKMHLISHKNEKETKKQENDDKSDNGLLIILGLSFLAIGAILAFGVLWQQSKKKGLGTGKT